LMKKPVSKFITLSVTSSTSDQTSKLSFFRIFSTNYFYNCYSKLSKRRKSQRVSTKVRRLLSQWRDMLDCRSIRRGVVQVSTLLENL
jgi:hypothetical protein